MLWLFYAKKHNLSWWMTHVSIRRICILLLSDGGFYKSQLSHTGWSCFLDLYIPFLIFCLLILSITERWMKSPNKIVEVSCSSISFCFMYFKALLLSKYTHNLVFLSSCRTDAFLIMSWPPFSLIFIFLQTPLSNTHVVTQAFFWLRLYGRSFFKPFIFNIVYVFGFW